MPSQVDTIEVELRRFRLDDATRLVELLNHKRYAEFTANVPHPYTLEHANTWLEKATNPNGTSAYAVELDGKLVACVSHRLCDNGRGELGYWVGHRYWRRGIATQAARMMLDLEEMQRYGGVFAYAIVGNTGSEKVLLNNGFHFVEVIQREVKGKLLDLGHYVLPTQ